MRLVLLIATIVLAATLVSPPPAEACLKSYCALPGGADGKTSSGNVCTIRNSDKNHNAGYSSLGAVCNYDADEPVVVTCPLLRDKWGSSSGIACAAAYLKRGSDRPTGCGLSNYTNWECIVQSKDETGIYGDWFGWGPMFGQNSTFDQFPAANFSKGYWQAGLNFGYVVTGNAFDMGQYFLSCELPATNTCGGSNCLTSLRWAE